jgi:hypothetical protein
MNQPSETVEAVDERTALLSRLAEQRQRMEYLLSPNLPASTKLAPMHSDGFPRSQTMRLLMNEPAILTGLATLAARALGPKLMSIVRSFGVAFRIARIFSGNLTPTSAPRRVE